MGKSGRCEETAENHDPEYTTQPPAVRSPPGFDEWRKRRGLGLREVLLIVIGRHFGVPPLTALLYCLLRTVSALLRFAGQPRLSAYELYKRDAVAATTVVAIAAPSARVSRVRNVPNGPD